MVHARLYQLTPRVLVPIFVEVVSNLALREMSLVTLLDLGFAVSALYTISVITELIY